MSTLEEHEEEQARITAECEAGECDHPECHEPEAKPRPEPYYVTMTWDGWPEGGSYGTIVKAVDYEEAEALCRREMAALRTEESGCRHCDSNAADDGEGYDGFCGNCADRLENGEELADTDAALESFMKAYDYEWQVVDCFPLKSFIEEHVRCSDTHQEVRGALFNLQEQVNQMRGMFSDEDSAIARAMYDADMALYGSSDEEVNDDDE